jgi:hypothetical protein
MPVILALEARYNETACAVMELQQISMICSMCFGIARLMRISNEEQGM